MPPRWANGVDGPTEIDEGLCCILQFLCTVSSTVAEAKNEWKMVLVNCHRFIILVLQSKINCEGNSRMIAHSTFSIFPPTREKLKREEFNRTSPIKTQTSLGW